jgi:Bacterial SCP ortholog
MGKARIVAIVGQASVRTVMESGSESDKDATALAVRYLLQCLADAAPGNTLEVRVPPYGAVQCVDGPKHTRGTPPNVVEMDADTWLELATGTLDWAAAVAANRVSASGSRASLAELLPIKWNARQ